MSATEIKIYRSWPVINGFVQVPSPDTTDRARVTTTEALASITDSQLKNASSGSGNDTGRGFGAQSWLELPGLSPDEWYETNPVDDVEND